MPFGRTLLPSFGGEDLKSLAGWLPANMVSEMKYAHSYKACWFSTAPSSDVSTDLMFPGPGGRATASS